VIYAAYFAAAEGAHPCVSSVSIYKDLWEVMIGAVHRLGHEVVHITDMASESWGDHVFRVDVDPLTVVYSRDVAWAAFVESLDDDSQAMMIEPDTLMLRPVPPLQPASDLCVLTRPGNGVPGWFRLSKKSSLPFYRDVVDAYDDMDSKLRVFHGDIGAVHRVLGIKDGGYAEDLKLVASGCTIETRSWLQYGYRKGIDPYFLQFKGTSKEQMLRFK